MREGRVRTLADGRRRRPHAHVAARGHRDVRSVEALDSDHAAGLEYPGVHPGRLDVAREPETEQAPLGRRPGSLRRKIVVADRAERALESPRIVAAVVVLVRVRHVR